MVCLASFFSYEYVFPLTPKPFPANPKTVFPLTPKPSPANPKPVFPRLDRGIQSGFS